MADLLVADASVIIKLFVAEKDSDRAVAVVRDVARVVAPAHALAEVAESFARKRRDGQMTLDQQRAALELAGQLFEPAPLRDLIRPASELAAALAHSVYDTLYLAAAIELDCIVVTADKSFVDKAAGTAYQNRLLLLSSYTGLS